jgi:membrane protein YdbS with pleckstrin-like domain
MGAFGFATLAISLFLFLQPAIMIGVWPWTLTPLTARVMGAMFALPGVVGLGIAFDMRWSAANIILQSQGFSILLILVAAIRAWRDFDWANPASWIFIGGLGLMVISIITLTISMQAKQNGHDQK